MNDLELGNSVISYAIATLQWGVACTAAWSCSTLIMGIVMFIIMSIVMYLLSYAMQLICLLKVSNDTRESIGNRLNGVQARITSLFTRRAPAAV